MPPIFRAGAKEVYVWRVGEGGVTAPSHQVVGKILNPSRQNMDLDRRKNIYLSEPRLKIKNDS